MNSSNVSRPTTIFHFVGLLGRRMEALFDVMSPRTVVGLLGRNGAVSKAV
jgi:hypothetical protein